MNYTKIWLYLFGTTTFLGIDIGFWIAISAVLLIVAIMNIIFWGIVPKMKSNTKLQNHNNI